MRGFIMQNKFSAWIVLFAGFFLLCQAVPAQDTIQKIVLGNGAVQVQSTGYQIKATVG